MSDFDRTALVLAAGRLAERRGMHSCSLTGIDELRHCPPVGPVLLLAESADRVSLEVAQNLAALAGAGRRFLLITDEGLPPSVAEWLPEGSFITYRQVYDSAAVTTDSTDEPRAEQMKVGSPAESTAAEAWFELGVRAQRLGDETTAQSHFRRAAAAGHVTSMLLLGDLLLSVDDRGAAGKEWFQRAASAGDATAMFQLGQLGEIEQDTATANHWYLKAAEAGYPDGMVNLGAFLEEEGTFEDAKHWYQAAAEEGHSMAMFNLGVAEERDGNPDKAKQWYRRAAEAGHAKAMCNLGVLAITAGDLPAAKRWYEQAAAAGDSLAMRNLADLAQSAGDPGTAQHWSRLAAQAETAN